MVQTKFKILNALVMAIILIICCGFQSSFWFQLTGGAPGPQLWLLVLLYLALYRSYFTAMGLTYAFALILKSFSAVPLGMLWSSLFLLISLTSFIKSRFFWSNTRYFIIASVGFTVLFNFFFFTLSCLLEENSASLSFFTRLTESMLTVLFSAPLYWFLLQIDRWTLPEVMETHGVSQ